MQSLTGIRVIENANYVSGPYAGMILADLGATVIKVERPETGDPFREWGGRDSQYTPSFMAYNRGKKSVTINLKHARGQSIFRHLASTADVVVENYRPSVAAGWGIDADALRTSNPELVYCCISGLGRTGKYSGRPTYDAIGQARSGLWSMLTDMAQPEGVGPAISDQLAGLFAALGVVAGLHERSSTGVGVDVDLSLLSATMAFLPEAIANWTVSAEVPDASSRIRRSQTYALVAKDGKPLTVHLSSPEKFWRRLVAILERPELASDDRFHDIRGRVAHYDELRAELASVIETRTRSEWMDIFDRAELPAAPIYTLPEALASAADSGQSVLKNFGDDGTPLASLPFGQKLRSDHDRKFATTPTIGEHNEKYFTELGYEGDEIKSLRAGGTI